jgi:hypothetical protein
VSRFNAALTARLQSTYLGGNQNDYAYALAIHPATGDVYVAGETSSSNFPNTANGAQAGRGGNTYDAFVSRFDGTLTTLLQSTYLGGSANDYGRALAIHPTSGEVYVVGYTSSTDFPGTAGGAQSSQGGNGFNDAFVSYFNAALTTQLRSTYLGGTGAEIAYAVAIHPATGEIYVAGETDSTALPGGASGAQASLLGGRDAFISRFNTALTARLQSTYLGGGVVERAYALAIHPATGEVYVAGASDSSDFPGTANGAQPAFAGGLDSDAFVSRLSPELTDVNRIPSTVSFIHQSYVPPNTIRTSNEVQLVISPNPGNNQQAAYVSGAEGSELCVTNTAGCCADPLPVCGGFSTGWFSNSPSSANPPYQFLSGDRIAVRHTSAASGTAETKLIISGTAFPFRSSTGDATIACNLDMNGDNQVSAAVEGLILVRAMLGLGADAIIARTGVNAWDPVRIRLNQFCGTNFPYSPSAFQ